MFLKTRGMLASIVTLLALATAVSPALALEKSWTLYHSANGGQDFARRASIALSVDKETEMVELTINNDNSTLNKETYLAAKTAGSIYQLKLVADGGEASDDFILASVPGCQLLRANFRYVFTSN